MAEDLQHSFIQELCDIKQVNESDIDKLRNEVQRISEWYVRAGSEVMCEKWLVAPVKKESTYNDIYGYIYGIT